MTVIHYRVKPGDTLGKLAKVYGTTVADIYRISDIADPNRIFVGDLLHIEPDNVTPEPPEPPTELTPTQRTARLGIRTDSRPPDVLLEAHSDAFGFPMIRHDHIPGAWNPQTSGMVSPRTTIDFWNPRGKNFIIDELVAQAEDAGGTAADVLVEFAFPLGLRGIPTASTPQRAEGVRQQLADVANGDHKWGYRDADKSEHPYIGDEGADIVRTYAAAVAKVVDEFGIQVTCRQAWECFGFKVFPWCPGGIPHFDDPDRMNPGAIYHTDGALDEFIAAYRVQGDVFAEYGIPLTMCGDKRALDRMADGPYASLRIADVLFDQLGEYVRDSATWRGPAGWGIDFYVEQRMTRPQFDAEYRPMLDYVKGQCDALRLPFMSGEWGIGSGAEDVSDGEFVDTTLPFDMMFEWLDAQDNVGFVNLYVPNNRHRLPRGSARRQWVFDYIGQPGNVNMPIYPGELGLE